MKQALIHAFIKLARSLRPTTSIMVVYHMMPNDVV